MCRAVGMLHLGMCVADVAKAMDCMDAQSIICGREFNKRVQQMIAKDQVDYVWRHRKMTVTSASQVFCVRYIDKKWTVQNSGVCKNDPEQASNHSRTGCHDLDPPWTSAVGTMSVAIYSRGAKGAFSDASMFTLPFADGRQTMWRWREGSHALCCVLEVDVSYAQGSWFGCFLWERSFLTFCRPFMF